MSSQPPPAYSGKVTVLNSGELHASTSAAAAASADAGGNSSKNPRRKVGTTFERSFDEPPKPQAAGGSRQVLKAGKGVASAPPAPQRPMTELEKEFAKRPEPDQRWLLSFPLALKQLYFGFAESPNHDQILGSLINRFPDLLQGSEQNPSAIQVAIQRGNWGPAMRFVSACADEQHKKLLRQNCGGLERRTFLSLAVECAGGQQTATSAAADSESARQVICALAKACPDLLAVADPGGRNPMHGCAVRCPDQLLLPLLRDIQSACRDSPEMARHLGDALVARDANGRRPAEVATSESGREALQRLQLEFPQQQQQQQQQQDDHPMPPDESRGVQSIDSLCATLAERGKSEEFVSRLTLQLGSREFRLNLLGSMQNPAQTALNWLKDEYKPELKQALAAIGQADLSHLVDSM